MILTAQSNLLAMADMSRTPYAIAVLLVVGILVLRLLRPTNSKSRIWLPVAAFVAGPIIALGYFVADLFLVAPDHYLTTDDYIQTLIPVLIIGFVGGTIGSSCLWIGDNVLRKMDSDRID